MIDSRFYNFYIPIRPSRAFVVALLFICSARAGAAVGNHSALKHSIREIVTYDSEAMEKMVSAGINSKEENDEAFYSQATDVLSGTILVHPRFSEREAGLSRLKSKMDQEEFYKVMRMTAAKLMSIIEDKDSEIGDQASALVALTNWVVEARHLPIEEMHDTLEKIAAAKIEISDDARDFAWEPLENLATPSEEALTALAKK